MNYRLTLNNPLSHFINIELEINNISNNETTLALPIWRPGRYEAANFAKYLKNFTITNDTGEELTYTKPSHSQWKINTTNEEKIKVSYNFYANKMDAGGSWFDDTQIYINFINCMIYDTSRMNNICEVAINIPDDYFVACGLPREEGVLTAKDYYELVDSPLLASATMYHENYLVGETNFHIWVNGKNDLNLDTVSKDFKKFTTTQIEIMGEFPEKEYHFLIHALPFKFYHGVEHHDSTVICLGPGENLNTEEAYTQLLGISSHELLHAWNIIKIRPSELMPYDFNADAIFPTGFVAEGFTTYYGDLFLSKSGVFNKESYFKELNTLFKRHFNNFGRLNYSVYDSSLDLWVDGYALNFPDRKSSIYVEGAMVALCLDLMIRQKTKSEKSLDDVMRILWNKHGKTAIGYTYQDVINICSEVYGDDLKDFFQKHVEGVEDKYVIINSLLKYVGCSLIKSESNIVLENLLGIKLTNTPSEGKDHFKIAHIAPESISESYFALNDEVISINGEKPAIETLNAPALEAYDFVVKRSFGRELSFTITPAHERYFHQYTISPVNSPSESQQNAFLAWTGHSLK